MELVIYLKGHLYLDLERGNGCKTKFWTDVWAGERTLRERFPAVYSLAKKKDIKVSECAKRINNTDMWEWVWHRGAREIQEREQYAELLQTLKEYKLKECEDKWRWRTEPDEELTVSLLRKEITKACLTENDTAWKFWNRWVPPKINLFVWRAIKNRIPVKVELKRRGIVIDDQICSRCGKEDESAEHLLLKCVLARATWWNVMVWLKLSICERYNSIEELFQQIQDCSGSSDWKKLITAIVMITLWQIWKGRNNLIFNGTNGSVTRTVDEIKELSFMWIKERSSIKNTNWERWKDFNIRDIVK
ncbi:putative reverse transcriptase zinc-binding domain-containing protein [Helianthus debilis subsp. tardiflorus]